MGGGRTAEQRAADNAKRRQRLADDPEFKARVRESQRRYREANPRVKSEAETKRAQDRAREWYADPKNREKARERSRQWQTANRDRANEHSRKWRAADPDRRAAIWIKSRHGLTDEQYAEILAHSGLCEACDTEFGDGVRRHIDHDHDTGAFRGLLCGPCNQAAGLLRDSPERARQLAVYLDKVTGPNRPQPGPRRRAASRP